MNYPLLKDRELTEKEITYDIRQWLRYKGIFHWKVWQGPLSKNGVSDILGILPGGRLLAVEVKTNRGRVSPLQQLFLDAINRKGGLAFVARSVDEVRMEVDNAIRDRGLQSCRE